MLDEGYKEHRGHQLQLKQSSGIRHSYLYFREIAKVRYFGNLIGIAAGTGKQTQ